jgi:hypothetical protein
VRYGAQARSSTNVDIDDFEVGIDMEGIIWEAVKDE